MTPWGHCPPTARSDPTASQLDFNHDYPSAVRTPRLLPPAAIALCVTACPAGLRAQQLPDGFRLDPLQPASPQSPFIATEGPTRPAFDGSRRLSAALLLSYSRSPLTLHRDTLDASLVGTPVSHLLIANASLGLQLSRRFSADLLMPASLVNAGDRVVAGDQVVQPASSHFAPGELRAGALYRAWVQPRIGFVAGVRVRAPTGQQDAWMGDGRWHGELLAGLFGTAEPGRYGCTLFFGPMYVAEKKGDRLGAACAFDVRLTQAGTSLGAEVDAAALRIADKTSPDSRFELWGSFRQPFGPLTASLSAGPGLGSAPGTAAFRIIGAISFAPQAPADPASISSDPDLDGIPNAYDACPAEAGPASEDRRRHGCPELDTDGDGVSDRIDACPDRAGVKTGDQETTGCPDTDNDRVVDKLDRCPLEPAETSGEPDKLGCPVRARLRGDRWIVQPPLGPEPSTSDLAALREIAFHLRYTASINQIAVEVALQGVESDEQLVEKAMQRAAGIIRQLVELGVHPSRLSPVGAVNPDPSHIEFVITSRVPQDPKR